MSWRLCNKKFLAKVANQNPTANLIKFTPVFYTGFPNIIAEISVPTLIFHGVEDSINNLAGVLYIRGTIPNSQLVEFPGGHMINVTQSKGINQNISTFVKGKSVCHSCICPR